MKKWERGIRFRGGREKNDKKEIGKKTGKEKSEQIIVKKRDDKTQNKNKKL